MPPSSAQCLQSSLALGWWLGPRLARAQAVGLCSLLRSLKGWLTLGLEQRRKQTIVAGLSAIVAANLAVPEH